MEKSVRRDDFTLHIGGAEDDFANKLAEKYGVASPTPSPEKPTEHLDIDKILTQRDRLIRKLDEKNKKIESLCVMLEAMEKTGGNVNMEKFQKVIDGGEHIDPRDSKIVSLAKKSHNLQMNLNKERAKNDALNQKLEESKSQYDSQAEQLYIAQNSARPAQAKAQSKYLPSTMAVDSKVEDALEDSRRKLQKENKDMGKLMEETKKKLVLAAEENKNLNRVLTRELGEGVTIEQAASGGWRGRAQQIIMLKTKIKRLESGTYSEAKTNEDRPSTHIKGGVDAKAGDELKEMSNERRKMVENLTEERVVLIDATQTLERKNTAQKARIHILESDLRKMKDNMQIVLEKTGTDDDLLEALRNEIDRLKSEKANLTATITKDHEMKKTTTIGAAGMTIPDNDVKRYQVEIQRLQRLVKTQAEQIDSQDLSIRQLKKHQNLNL